MSFDKNLTGYGPSSAWRNLVFDGDERKFEIWETKIMGYMKLKKLKKVFVGEEDVTPDQNETAFCELIQFLDERSLTLVMRNGKDNGREAFKILRNHYAGCGKPRIITLYTQLTTLKKESGETITDYILRAETAANALRNVEEVVSDGLLVAMVIKGLPDEYKAFVAVTTQSDTVQNFQKFKLALRNFEETEQTRQTNKNIESVMKNKVNYQQNNRSKAIVCYSCGTPGHKSIDCTKKDKKWCLNCKTNSHFTRTCRKKDSANKAAAAAATSNDHSFFFKVDDDCKNSVLKSTTDSFLVDCGATTHIVNNDLHFIDIDQSFNPEEHYVELADGTRSNNVAKQRGTVVTKFQTMKGDYVEIKLMNTLYIPTYPQCIFSVQAATKRGCKVNFSDDSAELIAIDGTVFPVCQQDRLYYLCKTAVTKERSETLKTWHHILGHCNLDDVTKTEKCVKGMKISDTSKFECETCTLSKQLNTRNREPDTKASYPFELVHTDLSGPIDPVAKDGFRYAIVFTDDYSGCIFTYFLKEKAGATRATEKFLADIAPYGKVKTFSFNFDITPSGNVKCVRSDNGGEFTSGDYQKLLLKHCIKHEKSAPYSPHQNGTAERSWRTLFDMARALIIESGLPKRLWTYAVMTATHIRNRCYSQRIKSTPYGLITGVKPNVTKLHVFGTKCFPFVQNAKKLDPRSKQGIFVGYDRDSPSYLVYNPDSESVSKHRLVKFTDQMNPLPVHADDEVIPDPEPSQPVSNPAQPDSVQPAPSNKPDDVDAARDEPRRYPTRDRRPPDYLAGYNVSQNNEYEDFVNSVDYCCYINTPKNYGEAVNCPDGREWGKAMDAEINSLKENETFVVTDLPAGKSLVGGKWVFAVKGDPDNPSYKARYVAKGYSQVEGIDYTETFSPTARMESVRTLMQIACQNDLLLHQMDVKSAYLHAPINEEVYVAQPQGYDSNPDKVWKLRKSLYGLKQSGRNWSITLHKYLKELNFEQSKADPCLFTKTVRDEIVMLLVWVDDIIIAASSKSLMTRIKENLSEKFRMKDIGELKMFLGIKFERKGDTITMTQKDYIKKVLKKFGMDNCKPRATPCELNANSYSNDGADPVDVNQYRQMVGSLVYAMICTRPDLSYAVTKLSQHLSCPNDADLVMLKHVLRYLKQTFEYRLSFSKSTTGLQITAFCDADWAGSTEDRRSITGYCISLNQRGPPISWKSKRQNSVALSTCEAEYVSLSVACQEVIYLKYLLNDILNDDLPTVIANDNQGAISLVKNPTKHSKAKHIDIRYHFVRECYDNELMSLIYVPSNENYADIFTKPPKKFLLQKFNSYIFGHTH